MATALWASKQAYPLDTYVLRELRDIHRSLTTEDWKIYIPQMIPRDHHFESIGDASLIGGGAFSTDLCY